VTAAAVVVALALDWLLGEPRRWHPLVGFGRYAHRLERWLRRDDGGPWSGRCRGAAALLLATVPIVGLCDVASLVPHGRFLLAATVLYLAVGHRSLHEHARRVRLALQGGDLVQARQSLSMMVSRDTETLDRSSIAAATIESVLENGNDAVFGALFWFAVLGAPGALLFRLVNTLDAMWGYRTPRYRYFGWAAARLDDALNWIPARLTALTYALCGRTAAALHCWRTQAPAWDSPNAGPVMAAGAGSLRLQLGGAACYHGIPRGRPVLGRGGRPVEGDIDRALDLVRHGVVMWAVLFAAMELLHA